MNRFHSAFSNFREYITQVPAGPSTFRETGNITADEFLQAGDYLVNKFPTWSWYHSYAGGRAGANRDRESGPASRRKDFLPPGKQYLVTGRVPCRYRPKALEPEAANVDEQLINLEGEGEEAWVATHTDRPPRSTNTAEAPGIPNIDMEDDTQVDEIREMDIDDISRLEDMQMPSDDESDDEITNKLYVLPLYFFYFFWLRIRNVTVRTRTYDLYITYKKYWRYPQLWLFGYTALGAPLPVQAILEDILTDYVDKTVTMETWLWMEGQSMSMASVHPCQHSHVMQTIIARQSERGDQVRVDQ